MSYLYAPQGDYSALQSRTTSEPTLYTGGGADLYEKQIETFSRIVQSDKPDYFYAERAVQVQEVVEKIYGKKDT